MIFAITPKQIKLIKTLARQVFGTDDAAYREMLYGQAKVKSCKELKGPLIDVVIRHLEQSLGIEKAGVRGQGSGVSKSREAKPLRATAAQLDEIRRRWDRLSLAQPWEREGALRKFLKRRFHVAAPEWLTLTEAQKVLNGLKAMAGRGGPGARGQWSGASGQGPEKTKNAPSPF